MNDATDLKILNILQTDARTSNAEIARQVGMAPSAILERIRKLEERGVVLGYAARLHAPSLGAGLVAFVFVRTDERCGAAETASALLSIREVQEIHDVAGEDCFLVKVKVADTEALGRLLREQIGPVPTIRSTRTTIVLQTLKETSSIPIPLPAEAEGENQS